MYFGTSIILTILLGQVLADEEKICTTPNGGDGECISLTDCEDLFESFANPKPGEEDGLAKYICSGNTFSYGFQVCCSSTDRIITKSDHQDFETARQLSNRNYCGVTDDVSTAIADFPWLATIILQTTTDLQITCGGVLINGRYVLTTASCIGDKESFGKDRHLVRFGNLNLNNEMECIGLSKVTDCKKYVKYGIEEVVPHPFYNIPTGLNDIALIRLNRAVVSNYIRPVCLPIPRNIPVELGNILTTTASNGLNDTSPKKNIKTKLLNNTDCRERFDAVCQNCSEAAIPLNRNQFCTWDTDDNKVSVCTYERGSPTMFLHENQWHILGILIRPACGSTKPAVYTKITTYLRWIARNVKL